MSIDLCYRYRDTKCSLYHVLFLFLPALKDEHWLAVQIESTAAVALACLGLVVVVFAFIKRSWTSVHWVQIIGGVLLLSTSKYLNLTHLCRMHFSILIIWTSPFPNLGVLGGIFHFYSNFKRNFCEQTVENLIRRRILRRLIWVCTVC